MKCTVFFIDKEVLMLKKFAIAFFAASTALLLSGCHSAAWYQNRAVERARAYLLEHSRDLTQAQIDFVRFNDPILLKAPIYSGAEAGGMTVGLGSELNQICVAWQIPDMPELAMVYGTSNSQMEYWYPERLIRKNFITHKQEFMTAVNNARNYAMSNLVKTLTPLQLNQIRFTAPTLYLTDFPASADPQGTLTPEESAKIEKSRQTALQVSLHGGCADRSEDAGCHLPQRRGSRRGQDLIQPYMLIPRCTVGGSSLLHNAKNPLYGEAKGVQTHGNCERNFKTRRKLLTNIGFCGIMKLYAYD